MLLTGMDPGVTISHFYFLSGRDDGGRPATYRRDGGPTIMLRLEIQSLTKAESGAQNAPPHVIDTMMHRHPH